MFNTKTWDTTITKLKPFNKLYRPEDASNKEAIPLFNGPRVSFGVYSGEVAVGGTYTGINMIKVFCLMDFLFEMKNFPAARDYFS